MPGSEEVPADNDTEVVEPEPADRPAQQESVAAPSEPTTMAALETSEPETTPLAEEGLAAGVGALLGSEESSVAAEAAAAAADAQEPMETEVPGIHQPPAVVVEPREVPRGSGVPEPPSRGGTPEAPCC